MEATRGLSSVFAGRGRKRVGAWRTEAVLRYSLVVSFYNIKTHHKTYYVVPIGGIYGNDTDAKWGQKHGEEMWLSDEDVKIERSDDEAYQKTLICSLNRRHRLAASFLFSSSLENRPRGQWLVTLTVHYWYAAVATAGIRGSSVACLPIKVMKQQASAAQLFIPDWRPNTKPGQWRRDEREVIPRDRNKLPGVMGSTQKHTEQAH